MRSREKSSMNPNGKHEYASQEEDSISQNMT